MSINPKLVGVFLCLLSSLTICISQNTSDILIYDYNTKSFESLPSFTFDSNIHKGHTEHFCGEKKIAKLNQAIPTSNLVDDTKFTNLIPIASVQTELAFPYTTGAKIILPHNNDKHQASGVMVGDKYVLTTAHSVMRKYTNDILFEKIDVIVAYDNSLNNTQELRSTVTKIYFVEDWDIGDGEDLVLLELEDAIGDQSGWMSIGYEQEENNLNGDLYHKMSYPAYNTPYNDKPYSGNDLHISYGVVDYVSPEFIGVQNHVLGLGGESGSPIFKSDNNDEFITYGVLTYLGNYNHTRFKPSVYYAFESILNGLDNSKPKPSNVLKRFEVSNVSGGWVMLNWDISDKSLFKEYEILRSYDQVIFDNIKSVDAANINQNGLYGYIDKKAPSGMVYYKLIGINHDNEKTYLDMKPLKVGKESMFDVNIYPNPTTDYIYVECEKELKEDSTLLIYSAEGKLIVKQILESNNTIATHEFEKGVYHILLRNTEAHESFSFVVQ